MYRTLFMGILFTAAQGLLVKNSSAQITETKLTASDGTGGDDFGVSISLSGENALVGADDYGSGTGSAYIFRREGSDWIEEAKLTASDGDVGDFFGHSVSLSHDNALVGAHWDDDNVFDSGAAYVFRREGGEWIEEAKLTASDGDTGDSFGWSVSLSGDYALVAAHNDDDNGSSSGSAYIFRREGSNWLEEAKLTASDGESLDHFGIRVSLSGDYAVVGAYGDEDNGYLSGSAYIFRREGSDWIEETKLTASDGEVGDFFGGSVSLSGDYALVGAYGDDDNGSGAGSAYVFRRVGNDWIQEAKLIASERGGDANFGLSVSLSGNYALVGAYGDDDNGSFSGSAYIFRREGSHWREAAKLTANDGGASDYFGFSVSLSGDYALAGAHGDDDNGIGSGSAYVYSGVALPPPPVSVAATVSPASGDGNFEYIIDLTNNTDTSETIDVWIEAFEPRGQESRSRVVNEKTLPGGRSYSVTIPKALGDNAPTGWHTFIAHVGTYPDTVLDSSTVFYLKTTLGKESLAIKSEIPEKFVLYENYPDPFNPSTRIEYALPRAAFVRLEIYSVLGERIRVLSEGLQEAGYHSVVFKAEGLTSGMYFYRLQARQTDGRRLDSSSGQAGDFVETRKLILLR